MARMTALKAIRRHCIWCMGNSFQLVRECNAQDLCPLWPLRLGKAVKGVSPLKTVRRKCLECMENSNEVKICDSPDCMLFKFRFGCNPGRVKNLSQK